MKRVFAPGIGLFLAVMLSGCGLTDSFFGGEDNSIPPTELTEITKSVQIRSVWSKNIGSGLNEAFVIYPFYSLHEVTSFERFLVDEIGIDERITFVDKVNSLLDYSFTKLTYYYSPRQLKELFPAKKIKHFDFYPDNPLSSLLLHKFNIEAKRTVDTLFGNIIFTQGNVGLIKDDDMLTFFDISNLSGRIIRRG